ncbi:hypothetical protein B0H11DRAFT_2361398 [Mycena galericulata]|nr:hypothetical protein B0H11DRAFT_2361398 [Mycena galericulata]
MSPVPAKEKNEEIRLCFLGQMYESEGMVRENVDEWMEGESGNTNRGQAPKASAQIHKLTANPQTTSATQNRTSDQIPMTTTKKKHRRYSATKLSCQSPLRTISPNSATDVPGAIQFGTGGQQKGQKKERHGAPMLVEIAEISAVSAQQQQQQPLVQQLISPLAQQQQQTAGVPDATAAEWKHHAHARERPGRKAQRIRAVCAQGGRGLGAGD